MVLLMPLPGSRVVHARWSERHRPGATSAMTAQCVVTRPTGPGLTGADGTWAAPNHVQVYAGPCRVVEQPTTPRRTVGDRQVVDTRYRVALRYDTPDVVTGDIVTVTESVDAGQVGRRLRVVQAAYTSEQWQRNLWCEELVAALPLLTDQVTLVRAVLARGYGNALTFDWDAAARTVVAASVSPDHTVETTGERDQVVTTIRIFLPGGTDVVATDRVEWSGSTWEIDGAPDRWPDPIEGQPHHVTVRAVLSVGG